jgi:YtoQ family protein
VYYAGSLFTIARCVLSWNIYLSGEIHSDWRAQIAEGISAANLPIRLSSPVTDHAASDDCAERILGVEDQAFWKDHKASKVNAIRTRKLIEDADVVVIRFGDKYKQWNAAFDAGYAAALGKTMIILHDPKLTHALKEVDAVALAVASSPAQVVDIMKYVIEGKLPA